MIDSHAAHESIFHFSYIPAFIHNTIIFLYALAHKRIIKMLLLLDWISMCFCLCSIFYVCHRSFFQYASFILCLDSSLVNFAGFLASAGGSVSLVGKPPPLPPLTMATKAESVASVTSQCSFSSTIVHVGDKKPPESGGNHQHRHGFSH